jgi:hypothetical protein
MTSATVPRLLPTDKGFDRASATSDADMIIFAGKTMA